MPELFTLTCPTCGAKLRVTNQIHLLVCAACGNEHMVHRDGGALYLAPIAQDVGKIRIGVDRTAAELAVARLSKEIADTNAELAAVAASSLEQWVPMSQWEVVLRVGWITIVIFAGIAMLAGNSTLAALLIAPFFASLFGSEYFRNRRMESARVAREGKATDLQGIVESKTVQLERNRSVAEN